MAQSGNDIANNLADSFSKVVSAPARALGDIGGRIQHALGGDSTPKQDTSWHDQKVREANASHVEASKPAPTGSPAKPHKMPKYHKGTDYVPKTGPAVLKKGEAVLDTKEAAEHRAMKHGMDSVASELGGKSEKPKKEIKHIVTKKAKTGGYIHEHHHTAPEHHPMEEHVSPNQDAMVEHMMQHMGTPNDGEEAAEGAADNPKEEAMESHGSPQMPM